MGKGSRYGRMSTDDQARDYSEDYSKNQLRDFS